MKISIITVVWNNKETIKDKNVYYLVHSGFPEASHSYPVKEYLENLSKKLSLNHRDVVIYGGSEGVRFTSEKKGLKKKELFRQVGQSIESNYAIPDKTRKKLAEKLDVIHYTKAIHPSAIIDKTVTIDEGSVVMAGSILNIGSRVGKHCIINTAASIDHDCEIADFAHISPNATLCGNVSVDEGAQIGAGAVINPNITIGKWSIVGAGAVIIKDVPDGATVVGNPGRII